MKTPPVKERAQAQIKIFYEGQTFIYTLDVEEMRIANEHIGKVEISVTGWAIDQEQWKGAT